jgi:hypothetical protein
MPERAVEASDMYKPASGTDHLASQMRGLALVVE